MKELYTYIVDMNDAGLILKEFLRKKLQYSHRSIVALKKNNGVTINGNGCHMNVILKANDLIKVKFPDAESENILPEQMELDIVFEDDYLIILNKKPRMPVHPTRKHIMGTLANGLAYYWLLNEKNIKVRPINRLDKDTSGLVVFAKTSHIQHLLSAYNGKEEFQKHYIAVVHGCMHQKEGTIDKPIACEAEGSMKRVIREDGDIAVTHYKVAAVHNSYSVLNITLETGRTHQIRVHMSYLGHPLLGDSMYGGSTALINRQALHAEKIVLLHPITKVWHCFAVPMPEDMQQLIL